MFLGHIGLAMVGKWWKNEISLGVLIFASIWVDLLWPILLLTGIERVAVKPGIMAASPIDFTYYPWSHSLLMGIIWGLALGGLYYGWKRNFQDALLVGVLVPSHWVLDFVVHGSDLPLWPGGPMVGLGLWNSIAGTHIAELGIFAIGVMIYLSATSARDRIGAWGAYGLALLLLVVYIMTSVGLAPADSADVAYSALAMWLIPPLAYWVDNHRNPRKKTGDAPNVSPASPRGN